MHYHCEIIMPPTDDIEGAVKAIMAPFNENGNDDDEDYERGNAFWDFYVIGGRMAGQKRMAQYDKAKIDEFYAWCKAEKVTVSGLRFGKPTLEPASQIEKVDAKWNEMFPSDAFIPCPIFNHSNDQHGKGLDGSLPDDVMRLGDVPADVKCSRVIIAGPSYQSETDNWTGPVTAKFMLCDSQWNGVNHMPVAWDETLSGALKQYCDNMESYKEDYREKFAPKDDWLVITVDYHS